MTTARDPASPPLPVDRQFRAMLGVDISGFTRPGRDADIRRHMQDSCYDFLEDACTGSGAAWDRCQCQDRGDGSLVFLPPDADLARLVREFPSLLHERLRRYNHASVEAARMQLRVAMHAGPVYRNRRGLAGDDITYLCRMLDAQSLRKAVSVSCAGTALSVSNRLYKDLVQQDPKLADEVQFRHVRNRVQFTRLNTWLHVPGGTQ